MLPTTLLFNFFWNRILICISAWLWMHDLPAFLFNFRGGQLSKYIPFYVWLFWMKKKPTMLVSFPSLWWNNQQNQLKRRKGLFWHMVSDFSVHGWLSLVLCTCGSIIHHGGSMGERRPIYLQDKRQKVTRKQRERERIEAGVPTSPLWAHPNDLTFFS
jgi:hypothetical protein